MNQETHKLFLSMKNLSMREWVFVFGLLILKKNEMVLAGLNPEEIIMENSYHGLEAVLKIKDWKKIWAMKQEPF